MSRELYRLVSYKIFQLKIVALSSTLTSADTLIRLQRAMRRERHYGEGISGAEIRDPRDLALWAYYRLLSRRLETLATKEKSGLAEKLRIVDLKRGLPL